MGTDSLEEEIRGLVSEWNRAILERDAAAAAELRAEGYTATLPDGTALTREEELALLASPGHAVESIEARGLEVRGGGGEATAVFENRIVGEYFGERVDQPFKYAITFRNYGGRWRASRSTLAATAAPWRPTRQPAREAASVASGVASGLRALAPRRLRAWARERIKKVASEAAPTFAELAYVPYRPGQDFVIPLRPDGDGAGVEGSELPVPPEELWLGYNYPAHGRQHVARMLEIVGASGFSFASGDRVLDFGCGAGRMTRHLRDLAATCEVWGTDVSAEHVYWCKQHLSPPFNFATTTVAPHLPFADGYFNLIYCGSVFTHIDDLADAWLLELRRVLAPEGRLYLTIHDEHTVELFETGRHDHAEVVRQIRASETYRASKGSFGMLSVGRGHASQVFYDRRFFSKTLRPVFDILSITPEAYFYQTAFLLKRK